MVLLLNYTPPTEQIRHTESNVLINVENNEAGSGTLFITENNVLWLNDASKGLEFEYKLITLHAISRDLQAFPKEHLLIHYEGKIPGVNDINGMDSDSSGNGSDEERLPDSEEDIPLIELRFIPQNNASLERMFEAIADCQTLHPDEDCQLSDEEEFEDAEEDGGGDCFFNDESGLEHLTPEGQANLQRFNEMLQTGQGDADITERTNQITLSNVHNNGAAEEEQGQFQDADDSMGEN